MQFKLRSLLLLIAVSAVAIVLFQFATGPTLDERLNKSVAAGDLTNVSWWLRLGADPNAGKGDAGYNFSPLQRAVLDDRLDLVKLLLRYGANPNYREKDGFTATLYAADQGRWDIVQLLVDADADCALTGADGISVVEHAENQGRVDIVRSLTRETPSHGSAD